MVQSIIYARSSETWPITAGTITESRIEPEGGNQSAKSSVRYIYQVGGNRYTGTEVGHFGTDPQSGEKITSRYPPGSQVEVHYHPDNPAVAVLEPGGMKWKKYLELAFPLGMLVFGILFFLARWVKTVEVWLDWLLNVSNVISVLLKLVVLIGTILALFALWRY
jgi:hypothetical protein